MKSILAKFNFKKVIAVFLSVVMVVTLLPLTAFAATDNYNVGLNLTSNTAYDTKPWTNTLGYGRNFDIISNSNPSVATAVKEDQALIGDSYHLVITARSEGTTTISIKRGGDTKNYIVTVSREHISKTVTLTEGNTATYAIEGTLYNDGISTIPDYLTVLPNAAGDGLMFSTVVGNGVGSTHITVNTSKAVYGFNVTVNPMTFDSIKVGVNGSFYVTTPEGTTDYSAQVKLRDEYLWGILGEAGEVDVSVNGTKYDDNYRLEWAQRLFGTTETYAARDYGNVLGGFDLDDFNLYDTIRIQAVLELSSGRTYNYDHTLTMAEKLAAYRLANDGDTLAFVLTAQEVFYGVSFVDGNGTTQKNVPVLSGSSVASAEAPTGLTAPTGYTNTPDYYWSTTANGSTGVYNFTTPVTTNLTLYAVYTTINQYAVRFFEEDGTQIGTDELVNHNAFAATTPADRASYISADRSTEYTFVGWASNGTTYTAAGIAALPITAATDFTAVFTSDTRTPYTATFYAKDANGDDITSDQQTPLYEGNSAVAPSIIPSDYETDDYYYTFDHWSTTVDGAAITAADLLVTDSDLLFYAVYEETPKYTVTFLAEDGTTVLQTEDIVSGNAFPAITASIPTKDNTAEFTYSEGFWDDNATAAVETASFPSTVTEDLTYTAAYTATTNQYTVNFLDMNGNEIQTTGLVDYGTIYTAPTAPDEDNDTYNYEFASWNVYIEGTTGDVETPSGTVTGDVTYIATYTSEYFNYTVAYLNEDGSDYAIFENLHFGDAFPTVADPSKDSDEVYDYEFDCWMPLRPLAAMAVNRLAIDAMFIEMPGELDYTLPQTVGGNLTLIATFDEDYVDYTVTYLNEDGSTYKAFEGLHFEDGFPTPEMNPEKAPETKDGGTYTYYFDCWTTVIEGVTADVSEFPEYVDGNYTYTAKFNYEFVETPVETTVAATGAPTYDIVVNIIPSATTAGEIEIPDETEPAASAPETTPAAPVPEETQPEIIVIDDDDSAAAENPGTGNELSMTVAGVAVLSALAAAACVYGGKKKKSQK